MLTRSSNRLQTLLDPWRELEQAASSWLGALNRPNAGGRPALPPLTIWSDDEVVTVVADVPGVPSDALELTVENDQLTIAGTRTLPESLAEARAHRRERPEGAFRRTVNLPFRVDAETVQATHANGVLEVRLARAPEDQPRRIEIRTV